MAEGLSTYVTIAQYFMAFTMPTLVHNVFFDTNEITKGIIAQMLVYNVPLLRIYI